MHKSYKSKVKWYNFLVRIFQKSSADFLERYDNLKTIDDDDMEDSMNAINKRIGLPPIGKDEKNPYRYI